MTGVFVVNALKRPEGLVAQTVSDLNTWGKVAVHGLLRCRLAAPSRLLRLPVCLFPEGGE